MAVVETDGNALIRRFRDYEGTCGQNLRLTGEYYDNPRPPH